MRIPRDLYNSIQTIVKKKGLWMNELEFIREAVREKLDIIKTQPPPPAKRRR